MYYIDINIFKFLVSSVVVHKQVYTTNTVPIRMGLLVYAPILNRMY